MRFELPSQALVDVKSLDELVPARLPRPCSVRAVPGAGQEGRESYTERLLKAKKKAWEERGESEKKGGNGTPRHLFRQRQTTVRRKGTRKGSKLAQRTEKK